MTPVFYSFRRCPYAIRARLALHYSAQQVELREVVLKRKPEEMLAVSEKGTVPVLVLNNRVIEESLEIMQWALEQHDRDNWLAGVDGSLLDHDLVVLNDVEFKPLLDRYKYFERYPEQDQEAYLLKSKPYLSKLNELIMANGGFLGGPSFAALDAAIFPFIRQFAHADIVKFNQLDFPQLQAWLNWCLASPLFLAVMHKYSEWSPLDENAIDFGYSDLAVRD